MKGPVFIEIDNLPELVDYFDRVKHATMRASSILDRLSELREEELVELNSVTEFLKLMHDNLHSLEKELYLE